MKPSAAAAVFAALFLIVVCPLAGFANEGRMDSRESVVDRALGGMEEGSRMPHPEGSFTQNGRQVPGSRRSPSGEQRGTAAPSATVGSSSAPTAPGATSISGGSVGPSPGSSAESSAPKSSEESVGSVGVGGEPSGGLSGGGGAGEDKGVGGGSVGSGVEPSAGGGDVGGGPGGGADLGSGTETGPGESGGGTGEPVGGGSSGGSIIDVDAGVSVDNGNVDANVDIVVDTEAGSLLELDAATDVAAEGPVAVEADSSESAVIETELGIEEGINDAPASGEAEAGIEADVDAAGESDEPISNPVDGLSL